MLRLGILLAALIYNTAATETSWAQNCQMRYRLENETNLSITEFFYYPSSDDAWPNADPSRDRQGPNQLGSRVLAPTDTYVINTQGRGSYEFRVTLSSVYNELAVTAKIQELCSNRNRIIVYDDYGPPRKYHMAIR
jgi:hypothetical protein